MHVFYLVERRLQDGAATLVIFKTPAGIFQLASDLAPQVDDVLDVDLRNYSVIRIRFRVGWSKRNAVHEIYLFRCSKCNTIHMEPRLYSSTLIYHVPVSYKGVSLLANLEMNGK